MHNITLFDLVISVIILCSSVFGLYRGMIKFVIGTIGFFAAIILAYFIHPLVADVLSEYIKGNLLISIGSGVISYIISVIGVHFTTKKIFSSTDSISGGAIDRILGMLLGILRGMIVCVVLYSSVVVGISGSFADSKNLKELLDKTFEAKHPKWLQNSRSNEFLDVIIKKCINAIPASTLESFELKSPLYQIENDHQDEKNSDNNPDIQNELKELLK